MKVFSQLAKNMRIQVIALLVILFITFLTRQPTDQYVALVIQLVMAVLIALLAEFAFFGAVKSTSAQSAVITGLLISLLLVPGIDLKILWFAVTVAIASKLLFRFPSGKHIFNPAAAGLILATVFWGNRINWWGFSNPYIVIILGGIILYRLNRLSFIFSYLISRLLGLCLVNGMDINIEMLLLPNLFFAFIMLVEPKTTPIKRVTQWKFAAGVGLCSSLLFTIIPAVDGDLTALLMMNFFLSQFRRNWHTGSCGSFAKNKKC